MSLFGDKSFASDLRKVYSNVSRPDRDVQKQRKDIEEKNKPKGNINQWRTRADTLKQKEADGLITDEERKEYNNLIQYINKFEKEGSILGDIGSISKKVGKFVGGTAIGLGKALTTDFKDTTFAAGEYWADLAKRALPVGKGEFYKEYIKKTPFPTTGYKGETSESLRERQRKWREHFQERWKEFKKVRARNDRQDREEKYGTYSNLAAEILADPVSLALIGVGVIAAPLTGASSFAFAAAKVGKNISKFKKAQKTQAATKMTKNVKELQYKSEVTTDITIKASKGNPKAKMKIKKTIDDGVDAAIGTMNTIRNNATKRNISIGISEAMRALNPRISNLKPFGRFMVGGGVGTTRGVIDTSFHGWNVGYGEKANPLQEGYEYTEEMRESSERERWAYATINLTLSILSGGFLGERFAGVDWGGVIKPSALSKPHHQAQKVITEYKQKTLHAPKGEVEKIMDLNNVRAAYFDEVSRMKGANARKLLEADM